MKNKRSTYFVVLLVQIYLVTSTCIDLRQSVCKDYGIGFKVLVDTLGPTNSSSDGIKLFNQYIENSVQSFSYEISEQCQVDIKFENQDDATKAACFTGSYGLYAASYLSNSTKFKRCSGFDTFIPPDQLQVCQSSCISMARSLSGYITQQGCKNTTGIPQSNDEILDFCSGNLFSNSSNCIKVGLFQQFESSASNSFNNFVFEIVIATMHRLF